jgi:hypothetical protein
MFVTTSGQRSSVPGDDLAGMPLARLEDEITTLAAHIAAATCRWLLLLAEFDRREGAGRWGCKSTAHWVAWRCAMSPGAAREHVRVARRLCEMPLVCEAFARGELSYSKARALTRAEGVVREGELLRLARNATASQLDRTVRGYRRVLAAEGATVQEKRYLRLTPEEDGSVVLRGRLPAEHAALLRTALEVARNRLAEQEPHEERWHKRAGDDVDALAEMAETLLATAETDGSGRPRTGGDRFQVVIHVDQDSLSGDEAGDRCETDDGVPVSAETARRFTCDASIVTMVERNGRAVNVGRKTRTIPPALRRALRARDGGCRFPGCTSRHHVDAHHIKHWARGGRTDMANLVQLCRYHHRLVHEGGFALEVRGDSLIFLTPRGTHMAKVPRLRGGDCDALLRAHRKAGIAPGPEACVARAGDPLDLHMAVDALWQWRGPPRQVPVAA